MNEEYKPINNLWKDSKGYRYFGTLKLSSKIKYDGDDFIQLWEWVNQLQQEMKKLNGSVQTYEILLKANTEENKKLKKVIDRASARLEYFLIGNLKYQSSQEEFIKLVNILKEGKNEK